MNPASATTVITRTRAIIITATHRRCTENDTGCGCCAVTITIPIPVTMTVVSSAITVAIVSAAVAVVSRASMGVRSSAITGSAAVRSAPMSSAIITHVGK